MGVELVVQPVLMWGVESWRRGIGTAKKTNRWHWWNVELEGDWKGQEMWLVRTLEWDYYIHEGNCSLPRHNLPLDMLEFSVAHSAFDCCKKKPGTMGLTPK